MFIFLSLGACLPKVWQTQCEKKTTTVKNFAVISTSEPSENFLGNLSRSDTQLEAVLK